MFVYTFKSLRKRPKRTLCTFKKCQKQNQNAYFSLKCSQIAILEGSPDFKGFKKSGNTQFRSLFTLFNAKCVKLICLLF